MNDSKSPRDRIARHVRDLPRSGIRDFFDIVSQMKEVISLSIGEPDFDVPWHIREAGIFGLEHGATHYTSNMGLPKLRHRVADYISRTFSVDYDPDQEVLVTVGVSEALDLAVRALVNPGDEVLYHEPCYVSYRPLILMAHGIPVEVEVRAEDDFRLTREQLESKVSPRTRLLLLNYPNNPTGATLNHEDVSDIADFAIENDLIVVTDEIYSELTYDGERVSIASLPGMKERTILLHGMSKAWAMTGSRIAYACAPAVLTEALMKIHQYTMLCAPVLSQEMAIEALAQPEADIGPMRDEYRRRRNVMVGAFNDMGVPCVMPGGAFYAFPYIGDLGMTSTEFATQFIKKHNVAAVPGTAFGACGEGYLRCSYATAMKDICSAMDRFAAFVEELRQ